MAFLLPVIESLMRDKKNGDDEEHEEEPLSDDKVYCLIISPTRELAIQIYDVLCSIQEKIGYFGVQCYFGGEKKLLMEQGNGNHITVSTPGRINDILKTSINDHVNKYNKLKYLVLDEADRLLDSNFQYELKDIVLQLPKQRRTGLFSATLTSKKIEDLIKVGLRNPAVIKLSVKLILIFLRKKVIINMKFQILLRIITSNVKEELRKFFIL